MIVSLEKSSERWLFRKPRKAPGGEKSPRDCKVLKLNESKRKGGGVWRESPGPKERMDNHEGRAAAADGRTPGGGESGRGIFKGKTTRGKGEENQKRPVRGRAKEGAPHKSPVTPRNRRSSINITFSWELRKKGKWS